MKNNNLKLLITETSMSDARKNWYTFKAGLEDNKNGLRKEIAELFKVEVLSIRTMVVKGKKKRSLKTRNWHKESNWKKVFVKVKDGQKIEAFDVGGGQ